jgi:DNA-binding transcriptional regulator YiaG
MSRQPPQMTRAKRLSHDQALGLRKARVAAGLTRAQLAVSLGVDPSTVARWEDGVSYPSPLALSALRMRFPGVGL